MSVPVPVPVPARERGFTPVRRSAEHGFTPVGRSAEHGFTLLEMLVALTIFSLAALALVRLEGATFRGATVLTDNLIAQMVARNVAFEALTDARPPALGSAQGDAVNGGRPWRWTRTVSTLGDGGALLITVAVSGAGGTAPLGRLTVVRAVEPTS